MSAPQSLTRGHRGSDGKSQPAAGLRAPPIMTVHAPHLVVEDQMDMESDGNHDGCETSSYAASVAVTATERVALTRHDGCGTRKAGIF
jgi:hypothetical protein